MIITAISAVSMAPLKFNTDSTSLYPIFMNVKTNILANRKPFAQRFQPIDEWKKTKVQNIVTVSL
jgi:hypothetical protein